MEWLAGAAVLFFVWWLLTAKSRRARSPAALSALRNLEALNAKADSAWRRMHDVMVEEAVAAAGTEDVKIAGPEYQRLAHLVVRGKREQLPAAIVRQWDYVDEIVDRANRAAQHYEVVSGQAAPPVDDEASRSMWGLWTMNAEAYEGGAKANAGLPSIADEVRAAVRSAKPKVREKPAATVRPAATGAKVACSICGELSTTTTAQDGLRVCGACRPKRRVCDRCNQATYDWYLVKGESVCRDCRFPD